MQHHYTNWNNEELFLVEAQLRDRLNIHQDACMRSDDRDLSSAKKLEAKKRVV